MRWREALLAACLPVVAGCTTLTTPILKHETGEVLGQGHVRALGRFEMGRTFPVAATTSAAYGVGQNTSLMEGVYYGAQVDAGVLSKLDVQAGVMLAPGGGGWRLGAKYQIAVASGFAIAAMAGYGTYSAEGTLEYLTATTPVDLEQILSANIVDLTVPISYRFSQYFAVYSDVCYYHPLVKGVSGGNSITYESNEFSINLGVKVNVGHFEGGLEGAFLEAYDPVDGNIHFVPFLGVAGGVVF